MDDWKELLSFNRSERRGIWLLLVLLSIAMGTKLVIVTRPVPQQDRVRISRLQQDTTRVKPWLSVAEKRLSSSQQRTGRADTLFHFDPNTLSAEGWELLGLSTRQAAVITGYTGKGGRFRTSADLRKSFVISDQFFQRVEPWVRIAPVPQTERYGSSGSVEGTYPQRVSNRHSTVVCLNTSDTALLRTLSGVGEVLAARIVRYRESLGGFTDPDQLTGVYGLSPEVVERNRHRMTINTNSLRTIAINQASQQDLARHPYISQRLAYVLVELRSEKRIASEADLKLRLPPATEVDERLWQYLSY